MNRYGYVENNVIKQGPTGIPSSWGNISGFKHLSDEELIQHGWYVWEFVEIEVDAKTEILENNSINIVGTKIVESQVKRLKTAEELADDLKNKKESYTKQAQKRLDDFAKTRDYDNIFTAISYASSNNEKFKAEAQYCLDVRDETWEVLYAIFDSVESGEREIPNTFAELEQELPQLSWPI